jgi:hypothetical protein
MNLFANANEDTVMYAGKGIIPRIFAVKVTGLIAFEPKRRDPLA